MIGNNYSTTQLLTKPFDDSLHYDNDGKVTDNTKFAINNTLFNVKNSKFMGKPDDKFETMLFLQPGEGRQGEGGLRTKGYFKHSYKMVDGEWCIVDWEDKPIQEASQEIQEKIKLYIKSVNREDIDILPLITVITVVFNGEKYLEQTIKSVINQTYPNVEYIIIDGGSTDGTLDIVKKYEHAIDYWVSEKDMGIADAWNKGIKLAMGDIIGILNSDDWYEIDTVEKVVNCIDVSKSQIVYGICKRINEKKEITTIIDNIFLEKKIYLSFNFSHTTCFKTRKVYKNVGFFNIKYEIAFDIDFLLRAYKSGISFKKCKNVTYMRLGGVSTNFIEKAIKEYRDALIKNGYNKFYAYAGFLIKKIIYKIKKNQKISKLLKIVILYPYNLIMTYIPNYFIAYIPFYFIRHFYYRYIMGIKLGKNSSIHMGCYINGNNITIGENSAINRKCYLDGRGGLQIGNNVSISPEVHLITAYHDVNSENFKYIEKPIIINDHVWIGTRVTVLHGVIIKKGSVISAGSVVTKDIPEFCVYGGVPAKFIKKRPKNLNYSCKWFPPFD